MMISQGGVLEARIGAIEDFGPAQKRARLSKSSLESSENITALLPVDCIIRIFSSLSPADQWAASVTCHRWNFLVCQSVSMLKLVPVPHGLFDPAPLFRRTPRLKSLTLQSLTLAPEAVDSLAECCPGLEELRLENHSTLHDVSLEKVMRACPGLKILTMADNSSLGVDGFSALVRHGSSLTQLELPAVCWSLGDEQLAALLSNTPALQALSIACRMVGPVNNVRGSGFRKVAEGQEWKSLKSLNISYTEITDEGLEHIASGCPELEVCAGRLLLKASSNGVRHLATGLKKLETLDIGDNNHTFLLALGRVGSKSLKSLTIEAYSEARCDALTSIAKGCPNLARLDFGISNFDSEDGRLALLDEPFPALQCASMCGMGLNEISFAGLVRNWPNLRRLKISQPPENAILLAAMHNSKLEELDMPLEPYTTLTTQHWDKPFPCIRALSLGGVLTCESNLEGMSLNIATLESLTIRPGAMSLKRFADFIVKFHKLEKLSLESSHVARLYPYVRFLLRVPCTIKKVRVQDSEWIEFCQDQILKCFVEKGQGEEEMQ